MRALPIVIAVFAVFLVPGLRDAAGGSRAAEDAAAPAARVTVSPKGDGREAGIGNEDGIMAKVFRTRKPGRVLVVAHRGASAHHADNSLAAFEAAIAAGADLIEADVRLSRDGVFILIHDETVGGREPVAALTRDELREYGVVTLQDLLALVRGRVPVLFDLKLRDAAFAGRLLAEVRRSDVAGQVAFGVRTLEQAARLRAAGSDALIVGFFEDVADLPRFFEAGGDVARLWEADVAPGAIERAAMGGHPVWVTTGGTRLGEKPGEIDGERLLRLLALGVDGVLVNDPASAMACRAHVAGSRRTDREGGIAVEQEAGPADG